MNVIKVAAFSDGPTGGNPAGVVLSNTLPSETKMQEIAAEVGFSETVFAQILEDNKSWRVRYFSPESEVPFCGHATVALGSVLANEHGDGIFKLSLNDASITVEGTSQLGKTMAALQSPPTHHSVLSDAELKATLALFAYDKAQVSQDIPPARIHGGADHYLIALKSRTDLRAMSYQLEEGRNFMRSNNIVTVMFVYVGTNQIFHARNAFASGGVLEDPATGAAAAAFGGYLRDIEWADINKINIIQGEDMGMKSLITAEFDQNSGSSIRISGATRNLV